MSEYHLHSQSLSGISGLFSIPIASIEQDGKFVTGVNYINRNYLEYGHGKKDIMNVYVFMSYLPFLEIGFKATRQLNYEGSHHTVDRMFNLKVRVVNEKKYLPSIAIGFNNPYSTETDANHFNSSFLVLTKSFFIINSTQSFSITIGYGTDIIKAADYQFIGLFGGISYKPFNFLEGIIEYDAERFNTAVRLTLLNHIKILAGLMGMKDFSGGIGFSILLQ